MTLEIRSRSALLFVSAAAAAVVLSQVTGARALGGVPIPTAPVGPPTYTVHVNKSTGDKGDVFYSTGLSPAAVGLSNPLLDRALAPVEPSAIVIAEKSGKVIWRHEAAKGAAVADFRTQWYQGKKVLTWWEGTDQGGHGAGVDYIADSHYRIIKRIALPAGYGADIHEFRITHDGRALITSYKKQEHDMSSIGGPKHAQMNDAIAFVVDLATGKVLSKWSALAHIPLTDTRQRRPLPGSTTYDPYHINSIELDPQGDLVMSFRNLSAIYDVSIRTGQIKWSLGGARPTLEAGQGVEFSFQHDAEFISPTVLQLFNDNSLGMNDPNKPYEPIQGPSSVQRIRLDLASGTASLVSNWTHPDGVQAIAMGNAQPLPNGHTFVGWGSAPRISELDEHGNLVYDASMPSPTYRAFLDTWPR